MINKILNEEDKVKLEKLIKKLGIWRCTIDRKLCL